MHTDVSEFAQNGNTNASTSSPTHNVYIYGGTFAMRYSYLHDPLQAENLHCRAVSSTIEYNWFDRAKVYEGDLMTSDDYANNPVGSLAQTMILRGNVIIEAAAQSNQSQIWAVYNDEASGSPVSFSITALYNTVISDGGHGAFIHVSNADGTQMTAEADDNIISGTSQPILVEDLANATVTGKNNWLQTGASLTGLSGVTGSIFGAAAGFTNATAYDFSLAAGSPCIGVADTAVGNLPVDEYYENETVTRMYRVRATAMDVGAFEHTTTGPGIGPYGSDGGVAIAPDAGGPSDAGAVDATADDSGTVATGTPPEADGGAPEGGSIDAGELPGGGEGPSGHTGSSGGCGCRVTRDGSGGGPWALALAGPAVAIVRRRRRRDRCRGDRAGACRDERLHARLDGGSRRPDVVDEQDVARDELLGTARVEGAGQVGETGRAIECGLLGCVAHAGEGERTKRRAKAMSHARRNEGGLIEASFGEPGRVEGHGDDDDPRQRRLARLESAPQQIAERAREVGPLFVLETHDRSGDRPAVDERRDSRRATRCLRRRRLHGRRAGPAERCEHRYPCIARRTPRRREHRRNQFHRERERPSHALPVGRMRETVARECSRTSSPLRRRCLHFRSGRSRRVRMPQSMCRDWERT